MLSEDSDDDLFGLYEGQCQACDKFCRVDDLSLCKDCTGKFERDLIRERQWEYSATAFGMSPNDYEELRNQVISEYGEQLELIAPTKKTSKKQSSRKRKKNDNQ